MQPGSPPYARPGVPAPADKPITVHGQVLRLMLGSAVALTVVLVARDLASYLKGDPYGTFSEEAGAGVVVGAMAALLWSTLFICTGLVFAGWMYRAARNNRALGATNLTWAPGWSWGGWFIPLANYVIPFLVLREIWRSSDPDSPPGPAWSSTRVWPGLVWFWALWTAQVLLQAVSFGVSFGAGAEASLSGSVPDLPVRLFLVDAAALAMLVPAGFLVMHFTRLLEARQSRRRAEHPPLASESGWIPPYGG